LEAHRPAKSRTYFSSRASANSSATWLILSEKSPKILENSGQFRMREQGE
jgi:hypothetical protein